MPTSSGNLPLNVSKMPYNMGFLPIRVGFYLHHVLILEFCGAVVISVLNFQKSGANYLV